MTDMAERHSTGTLQPDGQLLVEDMMDVNHVADTIVHVANLPNEVLVLQFTIM